MVGGQRSNQRELPTQDGCTYNASQLLRLLSWDVTATAAAEHPQARSLRCKAGATTHCPAFDAGHRARNPDTVRGRRGTDQGKRRRITRGADT